ncbi:MAG: hypothetical protein HY711_08365, partial [Candidatus Melainabacteria bacterium]|nr:hypothetical protein [Candidatus Melainabacteria bacterium]
DLESINRIENHLYKFDSTKAFLELLDLITNTSISKGTLLAVLPFLSCYIPEVALKALSKLKGELPPTVKIISDEHIDGNELRLKYQKLVDERRSGKSLQEEIIDMRADALCVCPINLEEQ